MVSPALKKQWFYLSWRETVEALRVLTERMEQEFLISETEQERLSRIDRVCGKYRDVPVSSEAFAARKQEEKVLEERRWSR